MKDLKITSQSVTKHRRGENSTFNAGISKEWFFMAHFEFHTGSKISFMMVKPRVEYAGIPTMEISFEDIQEARRLALADYENAVKLISDVRFLYAREKGGYCNIYGKDETSPTGVRFLGGVSSGLLADFVIRELGKTGSTLSPTEGLQTARPTRI